MDFLTWLAYGIVNLPWWGYIVVALALTHITILSVTIFLHRAQAHRALQLHPIPSHFFRFWLWLTTGMVTKEWAAIHRKHHAFSDKQGDPHSPHVYGIKQVLWDGVALYQAEANDINTISKYGAGTPDDWLERNVYTPRHLWGIWLMLGIDITLFGLLGLSIWAIQMLWIPFFAAGVINGIGHWFGYRNFENADQARNIVPWGIFIGGEELHNNHHTFASSAKLSVKWYEFDYGWLWICILVRLRLANVKKTLPTLRQSLAPKSTVDAQTLETIISNRYTLAVKYARTFKQECTAEIARLKVSVCNSLSSSKLQRLLMKDKDLLTSAEQTTLQAICQASPLLQKIFGMRGELSLLWQRSNLTKEQLVKALQQWCQQAETSGIDKLHRFATNLRGIYG